MKIKIVNKQKKQTENRIPYRAIVIGTLIWGVIFSTTTSGTLWLVAPMVAVYLLMALTPLDTLYEWLERRIKKMGMGNNPLAKRLYKRVHIVPLHLYSETSNEEAAHSEDWQDKAQAEAKSSQKSAA
jgi:hypothetical protein